MKNSSYEFPVDSILILGPTGSGKSPLGEIIASRGFLGRQCHHLDFGSELRSIASGIGSSSYSSSEQDFILGVLEGGLLLENEHFALAKKIIRYFLDRSRFRSGDVLILNGIPRHEGQAKDLSSVSKVHSLVVLNCSGESVFKRIEENTGGDRTGRDDDERTLVEKKLRIFNERTAPLIEHFHHAGSRVYTIEINERTTTESIYLRILSLASADPPLAFVAKPPER